MEAMRPQLIISLDPASGVREGKQTEFWVDSSRMHLFDPATGKNLTNGTKADAKGSTDQTEGAEKSGAQESVAADGDADKGDGKA